MDGEVDVRSEAEAIAAERKCPEVISWGRGVDGSGWEVEIRKGGGTSRRVRGW